ncbi:MAG: Ig-like domain-containing protein [Cytophagales bacterium]|nr:Ig-like domain-containing protein [Cytophagales bacterium]
MKPLLVFIFLALLLPACTGTDRVDDPTVGQRIDVTSQQVALQPGENVQLMASYFDPYGIARPVSLNWTSSNPQVAAVDGNGLVLATGPGQSVVRASFGELMGPPINVNVIGDENGVASVTVTAPRTGLNVGDQISLTARVQNIRGEMLTGKPVEWFSENAAILQVDAQGGVTALAGGVAAVHAKVNGVKSNSIDLTVGADRVGQFVPAGGYAASGTAMLRTENGQVILDLGSNFRTSFALGTYIYLANSTNAGNVRSGGLEVAQISENGAKTFNISALNGNVGLFDYRYVVILCKPATVTFGYADLN